MDKNVQFVEVVELNVPNTYSKKLRKSRNPGLNVNTTQTVQNIGQKEIANSKNIKLQMRPIFGSYSYDPINQAFEVNDKPIQVTTESENQNIENTVIHLLETRTKTTTSAPESQEATKGNNDQNEPAANNGEETSPFIMYPPSSTEVPPGRKRAMNIKKPYKKMQLVSARIPHPLRSKFEIGLRGLEAFREKVNLSMHKH